VQVSSLEQLTHKIEEEREEKHRKLRALQDDVARREDERRALNERVKELERCTRTMEKEKKEKEQQLQVNNYT
jgi:hypothetical protein